MNPILSLTPELISFTRGNPSMLVIGAYILPIFNVCYNFIPYQCSPQVQIRQHCYLFCHFLEPVINHKAIPGQSIFHSLVTEGCGGQPGFTGWQS